MGLEPGSISTAAFKHLNLWHDGDAVTIGNAYRGVNILKDMKNVAPIGLVVALSLLNGCNPASNPAMTGTWTFTLTPAGSLSPAIQATATLTQLGSAVTGQVTFSGSGDSCGTTAKMSGFVTGNALALQLSQSQSAISLMGTANVAFTSASGTYETTTGQCFENAGTGTWSAALD